MNPNFLSGTLLFHVKTRTESGSIHIWSKPGPGLACWSWPQHVAVAWIWGVCMCQVPGRQRHMSVSSAAIRGRNVCCLLPGSWADAGGSQSAVFEKAELDCSLLAPRPLSQPASLSGERCWHANQPPPFTWSRLLFSRALRSGKRRAYVEK